MEVLDSLIKDVALTGSADRARKLMEVVWVDLDPVRTSRISEKFFRHDEVVDTCESISARGGQSFGLEVELAKTKNLLEWANKVGRSSTWLESQKVVIEKQIELAVAK